MVSPYSRRVFLTYSVQTIGALPNLLSSPWLLAANAPEFMSAVTFKHLRPEDQTVLVILLPKALGVELNPAQADDQKILLQTLQGLDHIIDKLSVRNREDLMLLLNLLSMPLTRTLLGLWTKWEKSSREEVVGFLDQWERSSLSLKRFGYQSLVQLMEFAFYGVPENARAIGYPEVPSSIQPFLRRFSPGGP